MKRFYSAQTGCCYLDKLGKIPADAVEIPDAIYDAVIRNPTPGKVRSHDSRGLPILVDAPEPPIDLESHERVWRDAELASLMWLRERHRDQVEISEQTTLTAEEFAALLMYMQALRDWPQSPDFPATDHRPVAPSWIADQTP
ncbi:phage tail assembly chaperone [Pseudomonas sp. BIGb0164]|uniref:phage tail assembly chaperone n=1 Tax=Pseudomonas sp. BIGb0164 TaxID=2940605 RepID=UPI002169E0BB|nr:phage tail assembly chaperone [Pseudomonas sp. BIGb0164]MCS4250610.1 hypothetical protein [Pseudomonas sp. BIGb0164]